MNLPDYGSAFPSRIKVGFVFQLYRSDSDSSTLPKKSPFVRNTLERRTLRYKQVQSFIYSHICFGK